MTDSILTTIKKLLNIHQDNDSFDQDIIVAINTAFMTLHQLGVGPDNAFYIEDEKAVWVDFLQGSYDFNAVKTFVHLTVKLLFDPPTNGFAVEAIERQLDMYQWRLMRQAETVEHNPIIPEPEEVTGDKSFVHTQNTPSKRWFIKHELNKYPSVTIVDENNNKLVAQTQYLDSDTVVLRFTTSLRGSAYLN